MGTTISGATGIDKVQDGTIVNADINSSAAIAGTKLVMPTGSVLQVVTGTPLASNASTTTSGSWVNTGVSVAITPSSTNSKILVLQTLFAEATNSNNYTYSIYTLQRSIGTGAYSIVTPYSSVDGGGNTFGGLSCRSYGGANELGAGISFNHLDSPNTTSECTYLVYYRVVPGYGTARIQKGSTIMAMEIAG